MATSVSHTVLIEKTMPKPFGWQPAFGRQPPYGSRTISDALHEASHVGSCTEADADVQIDFLYYCQSKKVIKQVKAVTVTFFQPNVVI